MGKKRALDPKLEGLIQLEFAFLGQVAWRDRTGRIRSAVCQLQVFPDRDPVVEHVSVHVVRPSEARDADL